MEFTDWIFAPYDPSGTSQVPLTQYQEYCVRRFRIDRDLNTALEVDRFQALLWYIEGYGQHRKPMRHPFSAAQVRWMLEPEATYVSELAIPRIVEGFRQRALPHVHPYAGDEQYKLVAYWWSVQMATLMGIEHFAIPDLFIAALKAPAEETSEQFPISSFLKAFMERTGDIRWATNTPMGRLACYIRVLMEPFGAHHSLFFPNVVMSELEKLPKTVSTNGFGVSARDVEAVHDRVAVAKAYMARHRELRSGRENIWGVTVEADWTTLLAEPARISTKRPDPIVLDGADSILSAPMRVIGPINSQSGLGQATRMSIESLLTCGVKPQGLDFYLDNPAPRILSYADAGPIKAQENAINLIHLNAESVPLAASYLQREIFDGAYNIGYFFWELPRAARCHELALEMLDEVWVSSDFNVDVYKSMTDKPVRKVGIAVETLPSGVGGPAKVRERYGLSDATFVFMSTFDSYSFIKRKNPAAVLRAFLSAFQHRQVDVHLILKTHNLTAVLGEPNAMKMVNEIMSLAARDPRITIIDETLPFAELLALKQACDVYVTLHRSEGWGFGAVEAMQLGLPVIATSFSGNLEFCNSDTAYGVPFKPVYLERDDYIFVQPGDYWAEPDVKEAAAAMTRAFENPDEARAKGQIARTFVEKHFSPAAVGATYLETLKSIAARRF